MIEIKIENLLSEITVADVNRELKKKGIKERLVKGRGYFYFEGGDAMDWYTSSVMVSNVNQLTLDQWLKELEDLRKEYLKR